MGSHSQLSGSQPAAGIEAFRRKCWLGEHAAQAKLSTQRDAASSSQDDDQDELSCCGSSASDRSLDSSDVSFCPSFEEESDTDSEGDDGIEEVSSPMPGSSPRAAQQRQHQRVREAVIGVDAQLASAVPLPLDWLAQQAIPTTPDLDEALRSNGQLAYVPACSATPAALSLLASSSAKLHPAQAMCGSKQVPPALLGLPNKLHGAGTSRSSSWSTQSPPPRPPTPPCASWRPLSADACAALAARPSSRKQRLCQLIHTTAGHGRVTPAKCMEVGHARRQAMRKQAAMPSSLAVAAALASRLSCPGRLERTSFQQGPADMAPVDGVQYAGSAPLVLLPPSGLHTGSIRSQYLQEADPPMTAFVSH